MQPNTDTNRRIDGSPQPKPSRKRKASTPRAPRTIDPGVKAIRDEATRAVAEYHKQKASGGILKTIMEKRLPQLTREHQEALLDHLTKTVTPALIPTK